MDKVFFKGLNELRAIAALAVIVHHIELYKKRDGYASLYKTYLAAIVDKLGKNGVFLFFVLSGFLITYLLLVELKATKGVAIKKFYVRRALRIWPVYYFLLLVSFFLLPLWVNNSTFFISCFYTSIIGEIGEGFWRKFLLFLLFLPNLALHLFRPVAGMAQSWSVGVEEQFYIFWPVLISFFRNRILALLVGVIALKFFLLFGIGLLLGKYPNDALRVAQSFMIDLRIELMAVGGIGAYLLFQYKERVQSLPIFRFKWSTMLLCLIIVVSIHFQINPFVMGVLYLVLILTAISESSNIFNNRILASLGKVSYGLYMYHPLMMFLSFSILYKLQLFQTNPILANVLIYVMVTGMSIGLSMLSYRFLEIPFLKLKDRFTVVESGNKIDRI